MIYHFFLFFFFFFLFALLFCLVDDMITHLKAFPSDFLNGPSRNRKAMKCGFKNISSEIIFKNLECSVWRMTLSITKIKKKKKISSHDT